MVATALISLCVVSLAAAAPQSGQQENIVSTVISQLEQPIAIAVANALAGLNLGSSSSSGGASSSSSGSSFGSSGSSAGGAVEAVTARAQYDFKYQVADEVEQTYINHEENRDGNEVAGSYSYVDPNGALITVNYEAGAMGYNVIGTDKQEGFVQIRQQATGATGVATGNTNNGFQTTTTVTGTSSSSLNESDLIAQILAALTPQINSAVNSALGSTRTTIRTQQPVRQVTNTRVAGGDRFSPYFGN